VTTFAVGDSARWWAWAFWLGAGIMVLAKLALVSDLSVAVLFSPHDDSLYVDRAFHFLRGEAFGPYDSRTLVKLPGLSLWLAAMRGAGIPYPLWSHLLYSAAGIYFCAGLLRAGAARWSVLLALAFYLFNPMTLGEWWVRVLREPLSTTLFVTFGAAWLHGMVSIGEGRLPVRHALIGAAAFSCALYIREEERLLWILFVALAVAAAVILWRRRTLGTILGVQTLALSVALPALAAIALGWGLRAYVEYHYGAPILHELSEGEFPRLMSALRSVAAKKDNRMVMVPQETVRRLRTEVPEFAPIAARLPPPGPGTSSCRVHGVCSEWSNGWMLFLLKDAAYYAGFTPTLTAGQSYFRSLRLAIENACAQGRLACRESGAGMLPPMQLRWTRAYVKELAGLLRLALRPDPAIVDEPPAFFNVSVDLGRRYQAVTMTSYFDTEWQSTAAPQAQRLIKNPLAPLRTGLAVIYLAVAPALLIAMIAAFFFRLWTRVPWDLLAVFATLVIGFLGVRLLALGYVGVFMGAFDSRMMMTTFTVGMLLAVPYLSAVFSGLRR
jgi:hypothetical protein